MDQSFGKKKRLDGGPQRKKPPKKKWGGLKNLTQRKFWGDKKKWGGYGEKIPTRRGGPHQCLKTSAGLLETGNAHATYLENAKTSETNGGER